MKQVVVNKFPGVSVAFFNDLVEAFNRESDKELIISDIEHAEAALVFLYAKASESIQIFGDVVDGHSAIPSLKFREKWEKVVLNKEIRLEVVLDREDAGSYQVDFLKGHLHTRFNNHLYKMRGSELQLLQQSTKEKKPFRFTVVDERAYRYEYDTVNHLSYLNFNDSVTSALLARCFRKLSVTDKEELISAEG